MDVKEYIYYDYEIQDVVRDNDKLTLHCCYMRSERVKLIFSRVTDIENEYLLHQHTIELFKPGSKDGKKCYEITLRGLFESVTIYALTAERVQG